MSVGAKFARVVPGYTIVVVLVTLVSQISMLLSFYLPLKVIMLLGSKGVPGYFPQVFQGVDRVQLVLWLSIATVVFYFAYLLTERLVDYWADRGARLLLQKSQKITLFDNQVEVATSAYQRYTRCLAGGVYAGLAFMVLGILYPALAILVFIYSVGVFIFLNLLHSVNRPFRTHVAKSLNDQLDISVKVGFLVAFAFMVADFLFGSPPGLLVVVISLMLVRQTLGRLAALTKNLTTLSKQRLKINALFFHGQALLDEPSRQDHGFWFSMQPGYLRVWITAMLQDVVGVKAHRLEAFWYQTGVTDIVAFDVQTFYEAGTPQAHYFVKLFNKKRRGQALHEATLLMALASEGLPAPRFLGVGRVDGYYCHVFNITDWSSKPSPEEVKSYTRFILAELLSIEPPSEIVNRFRRSRPLLAQRLSEEMGERLLMVADDLGTMANVKRFTQSLNSIKEVLSALPMSIYNRDMGVDSLLRLENNKLVATHWGRWSLEPVGAGWPLREQDWEVLPEYFADAVEKRKTLARVSIEEVRLAALMFAFERFYERQRYVSAIELLPVILECLDSARQEKMLVNSQGGGVHLGTSCYDSLE